MYQNSKVPEELAFFDQLPDSANVRLKTVKQLFGISAATVWRQAGKTLPAPKKISARITVWNVGQLRRALTCTRGD